MMCQRIGFPPISTIGLGRTEVSSLMRVPNPPARMTAFTVNPIIEFQKSRPFDPKHYHYNIDALIYIGIYMRMFALETKYYYQLTGVLESKLTCLK